MKYILWSIIIVLLIFSSCEKGDPEIAPNEELSAISYNEAFICQPLAFDDHLLSLINRNAITSLCNFDEHGNRLWQKPVDQYIMQGFTYENINYLSLDKSQNGDFIINMFVPNINNVYYQAFKAVSFDSNGNFKWQTLDVIHQPDTIIIAPDTIAITEKFNAAGMVHLNNGNHIVLSYLISNTLDSTYLQISTYNNSGIFDSDKYLKIKGLRAVEKIFLTSDEKLAMFVSNGTLTSYLLMDLNGNIIFELAPPISVLNNYFFYENKQGNIIVSASYFENVTNFKGIVFCFDKAGNILWNSDLQGPITSITTSVQEKSDGYIFTGFNTSSIILTDIDWRTTFSQNKFEALIRKTGLDGQQIWEQPLFIMDNTAGAAAIGNNQISFFSGKFQNSIKNILLLKLDNEKGNIQN